MGAWPSRHRPTGKDDNKSPQRPPSSHYESDTTPNIDDNKSSQRSPSSHYESDTTPNIGIHSDDGSSIDFTLPTSGNISSQRPPRTLLQSMGRTDLDDEEHSPKVNKDRQSELYECRFTLYNEVWGDELRNKLSRIYHSTYAAYQKEFLEIFEGIEFRHIGFEPGSVVANFRVVLRNAEKDIACITARTKQFTSKMSAPIFTVDAEHTPNEHKDRKSGPHECRFTLNNEEWSDGLRNEKSRIYKTTYATHEKEFLEIFEGIDFKLIGFEPGSVVANFHVVLRNVEEDIACVTARTKKFTSEMSAPIFTELVTGFHKMKTLLSEKRLEAYRRFCSSLKRTCSEIVDVAAAKSSDGGYDFVVITPTPEQTERNAKEIFPELHDYPVIFRDVGKEGKRVQDKIIEERERRDIEMGSKVRKALIKYGEKLMDQHKNLNAVHFSPYKSVGFLQGYGQLYLMDEQCIVLYVNIKFPRGRVPIGEEEFPRELDGVLVDVRESYIVPLTHIGQNIYSKTVHKTSTMGPLVKFPDDSVGFFTSMHGVILPADLLTINSNEGINVVRPSIPNEISNNDKTGIGFVQEYHYQKGIMGIESGFEVGLIKFYPGKQPRDAILAEDNGNGRLHFNRAQYFPSIPGNHLYTQVFKYGAASGLTRGIFDTIGPNINRLKCALDVAITLCDQIGILGIEGHPFAELGDSGAIVVLPYSGDRNNLWAVGILTGQMTTGQYLVSPIAPILESFPGFELKKYAPEPMETD